jgi:hypothetical protein
MEGMEVGLGDEAGVGFFPFFVTANVGTPAAPDVNEEVIRAAFGGTIYPPAIVQIEPLDEERGFLKCYLEELPEYSDNSEDELEHWRALIRWFRDNPELHGASLVLIGETPLNYDDRDENRGCIHPRLVVGLTRGGSLVGIAGCVMHT